MIFNNYNQHNEHNEHNEHNKEIITLNEENYDLQPRERHSYTKLKNIMKKLKEDKLNPKSQKIHRSILDKYGKGTHKRTKKNLVGLSMQPENYGEDGFPQHVKHNGFNYKSNKPHLLNTHTMKNKKTQQFINKYKKNILEEPKTLSDMLYNLHLQNEHDLQTLENTGYESDDESNNEHNEHNSHNEHNEYHKLFSEFKNLQDKKLQEKKPFTSSQSYSNTYSKTYSQIGNKKPEVKENKISLTTYTNSTLPHIYYKLTQGNQTHVNKIPKNI